MCKPHKHRALLKREINQKKAGQILLSFTPLGWAAWMRLPRWFGKVQPFSSMGSFAQLLWTECKCTSCAVPSSCSAIHSAAAVGAALLKGCTGSQRTHKSQSDFSFWLADNINLEAPFLPAKAHSAFQNVFFFVFFFFFFCLFVLVKTENIFFFHFESKAEEGAFLKKKKNQKKQTEWRLRLVKLRPEVNKQKISWKPFPCRQNNGLL